jgi:cobalt/nickel transport system permease protein
MLYSSLHPMHIPDGFLSALVSLTLWIVSIIIITYALKRVGRDLGERQVPLMGVLAAAIFAGQMLNFAVTGGTSGHLLGAALATILVGPWAAMVVMATVVSIQAIIFQDGGLLALGPNLFNMAVVGVAVAHFTFTSIRRFLGDKPTALFVSAALAAWLSIVAASLVCALELAASGTSPANVAIPAMAGIHMFIGIGEALISVGALAFLYAARPDLLHAGPQSLRGSRAVWIGGGLLAIVLAVLSPIASSHPDGLEWVAEQQGFLNAAQGPLYNVMPDYVLPGVSNEALATILAGIIGVVLVFITAAGVSWLRKGKTIQDLGARQSGENS